MTTPAFHELNNTQIEAFQRDGALSLPGVFSPWIDRLSRGVDRLEAEPDRFINENSNIGETGHFWNSYCYWQDIPEFTSFVMESMASSIAAQAMKSRTAQMFHEHLVVKESGTAKDTPWHHDFPYYNLNGTQGISIWIALDPVPADGAVRFVAGSHRWGKLFQPRWFKDGTNYEFDDMDLGTVPDIDADLDNYSILNWACEPGDAVLFDFRTLHGTTAAKLVNRRRGFATRWLGDDMTYVERQVKTSPPFPGINLKTGDRMREDWFPVVWDEAR